MKKVPQLRDDEADESCVHPAEAMEPCAALDPGEGIDLFRRLLTACMPAKGEGGPACFLRMVAVSYVVWADLFEGMKPHEVAASVGLPWRAFSDELRAAREMVRADGAVAHRRPGRAPAGPDANRSA